MSNATIKSLILGFCVGVIVMISTVIVLGVNYNKDEPNFKKADYDFGDGEVYEIMFESSNPSNFKILNKR